jgi:hypothetical protein
MTEISFKIDHASMLQARRAAARAVALNLSLGGFQRNQIEWEMDFIATHANGNALDFAKLNSFDAANFAHDACGIARHLDRESGKLRDCFSPRCSV